MAASSFGQYLSTAMEPTIKATKKIGSKALGPALSLLAAYDAEQELQKGKTIPQAIGTGVESITGVPAQSLVNYAMTQSQLTEEEKDIQKRMRAAESADAEDITGEGLMSLMRGPGITEQERKQLESGIKDIESVRELEEAIRADEYNQAKEELKFRLGLEDGGPADPSRRRLLKGLAALGAIPILGPKIFKPAAKGIETLAPVVSEGVSKGQEIFGKLVSTVITKGKMEPEKKGITKYKYKDIEVEDNPGETIARFKTDKGADAEVVYRKPTTTEEGQRIPGEFEEYQQVFKGGDDVTEEMEIIDTLDNVKKAISE